MSTSEDLTSEESQQDAAFADESAPREKKPSTSVQTGPVLVLSLFLLLLAFFILLVSMAEIDDSKREAVFSSLAVTFLTNRRPQDEFDVVINDTGDYLEQDFLDLQKKLWLSLVPLARIDEPTVGNYMQVTVPINDLFEPNSSRLLKRTREIVDNIIATQQGSNEYFNVQISFKIRDISSIDIESTLKQYYDGAKLLVEFRDRDQENDLLDPRSYFSDLKPRQTSPYVLLTNKDTLQLARTMTIAYYLEESGADPLKTLLGIQEGVADTVEIRYERVLAEELLEPTAETL